MSSKLLGPKTKQFLVKSKQDKFYRSNRCVKTQLITRHKRVPWYTTDEWTSPDWWKIIFIFYIRNVARLNKFEEGSWKMLYKIQTINKCGVLDGVTLGYCWEHLLCCPLEVHFRAITFSISVHWSTALNSLWYSFHGPVSLKVGILNVLGFPTITEACLVRVTKKCFRQKFWNFIKKLFSIEEFL